ncbi:hypothetical protein L6R29_09415 [Myxococcota bacterium]|nr:hypothetical protein [Myxococcota bacterium]
MQISTHLLRIFCFPLLLGLLLTFSACPSPPPKEAPPETTADASDASPEKISSSEEPHTSESSAPPESSETNHEAEAQTEPSPEPRPECPTQCTVTSRCVGTDRLERCNVREGCVIWEAPEPCGDGKTCQDGLCVTKSCDGPGQCGAGYHCENKHCASNASCCKVGSPRCTQQTEQTCTQGDDNCGKWTDVKTCRDVPQDRQACYLNQCTDCYQRPCATGVPCCPNTTCLYGYCLQQCDESKGDINNPECKPTEYCFSLSSGQPALCFPDATEPKGAPCSIVKICQVGLSCADIGQGLRCYTDCDLNQCAVGNPNCETNEQCVPAAGTTLNNICVPLQATPAKLHEACNASTPCDACNLCVGETSSAAHCLKTCNPSASNPNCPTDFLCAAYDPSKPTQGVCLQRCTNPGSKDICTYGTCRDKSGQHLCL